MKTSTGQPITQKLLAKPPIHIPNDEGEQYKTELSIFRSEKPIDIKKYKRLKKLLKSLTGLSDISALIPEGGITHIRLTWWHLPDFREHPHNHPWNFNSFIINGGYTERKYTKASNAVMLKYNDFSEVALDYLWEDIEHKENGINVVQASSFHEIVSIQPGTVTLMICGPLIKNGEWGYLINDEYKDNEPDKKFIKNLKENNHFL